MLCRINLLSHKKVALKLLRSNTNIFGAKFLSTSTNTTTPVTPVPTKDGGWFGKDSNIASEGFKNRWLMCIPAVTLHLCIGSPWSWSLIADAISRENGFVVAGKHTKCISF